MTRGRISRLSAPLLLIVLVTSLFAAGPVASAQSAGATTTPIKHFVMLMQENHSFDNYFGTYPGADGLPPGVCMPMDPERSDQQLRASVPHRRAPTSRLPIRITAMPQPACSTTRAR